MQLRTAFIEGEMLVVTKKKKKSKCMSRQQAVSLSASCIVNIQLHELAALLTPSADPSLPVRLSAVLYPWSPLHSTPLHSHHTYPLQLDKINTLCFFFVLLYRKPDQK